MTPEQKEVVKMAEEFVEEVYKKFEKFYEESPFAKVERFTFTRDEVRTAMHGSYLAGHTQGFSIVDEMDKILKKYD